MVVLGVILLRWSGEVYNLKNWSFDGPSWDVMQGVFWFNLFFYEFWFGLIFPI
jgi:hypothetical protein